MSVEVGLDHSVGAAVALSSDVGVADSTAPVGESDSTGLLWGLLTGDCRAGGFVGADVGPGATLEMPSTTMLAVPLAPPSVPVTRYLPGPGTVHTFPEHDPPALTVNFVAEVTSPAALLYASWPVAE